jgi:hypothetical protein
MVTNRTSARRRRKATARRRYGPLFRIAVEIAAGVDGRRRSIKTAYSVMRGWMKSAVMSSALKQARRHPEYRCFERQQRRLREEMAA